MLQKLGRAKYEHFENSQSVEIIDKATSRAMNSARHLYPMYLFNALSGAVASIGLLWQLGQAKWWLLLTTLIPFALHRWYGAKHSYNIYDELEHYWNKERRYGILAGFLKSRDYLYEGKLNGCADFLIRTYRDRLHERNKEYETYYFKHLKQHLLRAGSIMNLASLGNALLLLYLYAQGEISIGSLVALSAMVLSSLSQHLSSATGIVIWAGYHLQFTDYYDKFFALSEDSAPGKAAPAPETFDIEFRDVWFRYPGSEENPYILKGLSFHLAEGEKISIVGANGEGKSTMIKLLLGLFEPERGQILLGGRPIEQYTREQRNRVFAPVFQDFMRYSISLRENIAVGDIELLHDESAILAAAEKGQAKKIADGLKDGMDTLLGRDFEGGVDLSGGQWQRIALSRAFMGDKPILLLDEPPANWIPWRNRACTASSMPWQKAKPHFHHPPAGFHHDHGSHSGPVRWARERRGQPRAIDATRRPLPRDVRRATQMVRPRGRRGGDGMNDRTSRIEETIRRENPPKFRYLPACSPMYSAPPRRCA